MNKIINILKAHKSIPLDKFINISLYDKDFGYYIKKNPFGKQGDFVTSPLVSNLFGEMIAIWCVSFWEHLKKPKKILLVELGPGDGSLCIDLIRTFKNFKNFYDSVEINLLEKSNKLIKIQKSKIKNNKVKWIKKIRNISSGPIIFIGNEFFDSLPIKQIYKKEKLFFERHITLDNDKKIKFLYKKANKNLIKNIKKLDLISSGNIIEYPIKSLDYIDIIAEKIKKFNGGLLTFDYGYTKNINQDTLQSVENHKFANTLSKPGSKDITSHVNFKLLSSIFKRKNLDVGKIATQNQFLQKLGIIERANLLSKNMNFKAKADLYYRLKKLLDYSEMGNLFKVIFAKKKGKKFSLGFE